MNMKIIARGNGFKIGYEKDGTPVQTDSFGEWIEAQEGTPFTDEECQEYRCYDGEWTKTDDCGNVE